MSHAIEIAERITSKRPIRELFPVAPAGTAVHWITLQNGYHVRVKDKSTEKRVERYADPLKHVGDTDHLMNLALKRGAAMVHGAAPQKGVKVKDADAAAKALDSFGVTHVKSPEGKILDVGPHGVGTQKIKPKVMQREADDDAMLNDGPVMSAPARRGRPVSIAGDPRGEYQVKSQPKLNFAASRDFPDQVGNYYTAWPKGPGKHMEARVASWKQAKQTFFTSYGQRAIDLGKKLFGDEWTPENTRLAQMNTIGKSLEEQDANKRGGSEKNEYEHLMSDLDRPTKDILKHLADVHGVTDPPKARKGYEKEVAIGKHESVHRMDAGGIGHDKTGAATFEKKEPAVHFITYDGRVIPLRESLREVKKVNLGGGTAVAIRTDKYAERIHKDPKWRDGVRKLVHRTRTGASRGDRQQAGKQLNQLGVKGSSHWQDKLFEDWADWDASRVSNRHKAEVVDLYHQSRTKLAGTTQGLTRSGRIRWVADQLANKYQMHPSVAYVVADQATRV